MPPCGYRPTAVDGMKAFLLDNLDYFVELYSRQGLTVHEALTKEFDEITRIRGGARGGAWSAKIVEINQLFYDRLAARGPQGWNDVRREGRAIIANAEAELASLLLESA